MKQNESVKKLKIGKDYINVNGGNVIIIDYVEGFDNRGFEGVDYKKDLFCLNSKNWREATESEVIEAFKKHLVHRYGKDWETMKIKEKHSRFNPDYPINDNSYVVKIAKDYYGWNVWNENGLLYCNGIWVERLEEEPTKSTDWSPSPEDIEEIKIKISSNVDKKRYEVIKTILLDFKQLSLGDNKTNKVIAHFVNQDEDTLLLAEKIADILNLIEK